MLLSLRAVGTATQSVQTRLSSSSIRSLQAAFKDPSSPFHLPPGTEGPSSPDQHPVLAQFSTSSVGATSDHPTFTTVEDSIPPEDDARSKLLVAGYDPLSFWEQKIVWGDHDSFQHVNNVRYVRFLESGRMKWITSLAEELGGSARAQAMLKGKGVSLILKSIAVNFRRPVTYPDTLLLAHRPHSLEGNPTQFGLYAAIYSYAQRAIVAESDSVLVWYDYDKLKKCDPGEEVRAVLRKRVQHNSADPK